MSQNPTHTNQRYWRDLEEINSSVETNVSGEFDSTELDSSSENTGLSRRKFMALASASMALATAACRRPDYKFVPSVKSPENLIPGLPLHYATGFAHKNAGFGLLVKTREGRPIKVEGNDRHIVSGGKSTAIAQAQLLSLYDPDRLRSPTINSSDTTPHQATMAVAKFVTDATAAGKSSYIIIDDHCSPTFAKLLGAITSAIPTLKVITQPSFVNDCQASVNLACAGVDGEFVPNLSGTKVILSVESDFLGTDKNAVFHMQKFASGRKPTKENPTMSKLISAEATYSLTGANADERIKVAPHEIEGFLASVLHEVSALTGAHADVANSAVSTFGSNHNSEAKSIAKDLVKCGSASVVLVGNHLSKSANAIGLAINSALASTAINTSWVLPNSGAKWDAIDGLKSDFKSGNVGAVILAGVNPEYNAHRECISLLREVKNKAAIGLYQTESSVLCQVDIPAAHTFESWGDGECFDGSKFVQQPLIAPLAEGTMSIAENLFMVAKQIDPTLFADTPTYYDFLRNNWKVELGEADFEKNWEALLKDGVKSVAATSTTLNFNSSATTAFFANEGCKVSSGMTLVVRPSYNIYDGELANNSWLQENPDPVTKICWDNVALMSPATALKLDVKNEDMVSVTTTTGSCELPVWIQFGMADNTVATQAGYGRGASAAGKVLKKVGVNTFPLMSGMCSNGYTSCKVQKIDGKAKVATTQNHHTIDGRTAIVRQVSLGDFANGHGKHESHVERSESNPLLPLSIVGDYKYNGHRWGMTVDMSACTGCGACIVACQAENNIPSVGKEQVRIGREMHWIRIDRYYMADGKDDSAIDNPKTVFQPMWCQHCENAPCENVCPVAATSHSPEGLNEMVYNRCVGTRYCLNNCPYKVRRFNFLNFHKFLANDTRKFEPLNLVFNPDVTIRMRGVMEKCTFCIQRINEAKYSSRDAGHQFVPDGELKTACEQACPASAILFGNSNDKKSRVSLSMASDRGYKVLEELNVRPQITYLTKVRNAELSNEEHKA